MQADENCAVTEPVNSHVDMSNIISQVFQITIDAPIHVPETWIPYSLFNHDFVNGTEQDVINFLSSPQNTNNISSTLMHRTGSDSCYAQVFTMNIHGKYFALKLLPILPDQSEACIRNEINITHFLSSVQSSTGNYAKLFAAGPCSSVLFQQGTFYKELQKQAMLQGKLIKKQEQENEKAEEPLPAYFIIMQHLQLDLRQWLQNKSPSEIKNMLVQILQQVIVLHKEMNIEHCDLHIGNVMIHHDKPYIIDFGKSRFNPLHGEDHYRTDVNRLFEAVKEQLQDYLQVNTSTNSDANRKLSKFVKQMPSAKKCVHEEDVLKLIQALNNMKM